MLISSSNQYSEYAKSGDVITIRLISSIPFQKYEKKPNEASFLMTLASWKDDNIYLSDVEANSCTVSGTTCKIIYIVPDMEDVEMPVRNKIYFIYNDNSKGAFYKRADETDENMQISDNLMLDSNGNRRYIEYEKLQNEIKLAHAVNESLNVSGIITDKIIRNNIYNLGWNLDYTVDKYKIKLDSSLYNVDLQGNIEKNALLYFTVNTNIDNANIQIRNLTQNTYATNILENGETNRVAAIQASSGDVIEYNVTKDYYRYRNGTDIGGNEPMQKIIEDESITETINLIPNYEFPGLVSEQTVQSAKVSSGVKSSNGIKTIGTLRWQGSNGAKVLKITNIKLQTASCNRDEGATVYLRVTIGMTGTFEVGSCILENSSARKTIEGVDYISNYDDMNESTKLYATIGMYAETPYVGSTFRTNTVTGLNFSALVTYVEK